MELSTYLQVLNRRKWIVIVTVCVSLVVVISGLTLMAPSYQASVELRILTTTSGSRDFVNFDVLYADRLMNTYAELATSQPILDQLAYRLGLDRAPSVKAEVLQTTEVLRLTVEDHNPLLAREAANTLAAILVEETRAIYIASRTLIDQPTDAVELSTPPAISVLDPAALPSNPARPNKKLYVLLSLVASVAAGTGLAFVVENLDMRVYSPQQVKTLAQLSLLGEIPHVRHAEELRFLSVVFPYAESFRHARAQLLAALDTKPSRLLLVTSAEPGEGKSMITANLAISLAQAGHRVAVVDADMRRPTQHTIFDLDNEAGLSDVLLQSCAPDTVVRSFRNTPIRVVTSGTGSRRVTDLLDSDCMSSFLDWLASESDIVLVDAPAFLATADTAAIVPHVDGVLLVVGRGNTSQEAIEATCRQINNIGTGLVGVILNHAQNNPWQYYHYYKHDDVSARETHVITKTNGDLWWTDLSNLAESQANVVIEAPSRPDLRQWVQAHIKPDQLRAAIVRRLTIWDVLVIVLMALWLLGVAVVQRGETGIPGVDPILQYFPIAQGLLDGKGYHVFALDVWRGPGYPTLLALTSRMSGLPVFETAKLISALTSIGFLAAAYALIRQIFDPLTASLGLVMMMGVNTFTWLTTSPGGTDLPCAMFALIALFFLARQERLTRWDALVAGLFAGLSLTVRWTGQVFPLFVLARVALLPRRDATLGQRARLFVIFMIGFLITCGPWLAINADLNGSPLYNENGISVDSKLLTPTPSLQNAIRNAVQEDPIGFPWRWLKKSFTSFPRVVQGLQAYPTQGGWIMSGYFWLLIAAGGALTLARPSRRKIWLLMVFVGWWMPLVLMRYEPRVLLMVLPIFTALVATLFTSHTLPDLHLMRGGSRWHTAFTPGWMMERVRRQPPPQTAALSLLTLAFLVILLPMPINALRRIEGSQEWINSMAEPYHEVAEFLNARHDGAERYPVAVRQYSQARYWLPKEADTPAAPFPIHESYETLLPHVGYVLYDQLNDADQLFPWWDNTSLAGLNDLLNAPDNLEAVYYRRVPWQVILYQVLAEQHRAEITTVAPASDALIDNTADTVWTSYTTGPVSLTFTLAAPMRINRVWLLPGQDFPTGVQVETSLDGDTWKSVSLQSSLAPPLHQSPHIINFAETEAQYVRLTLTPAVDRVSLAELRISYAIPQSGAYSEFALDERGVTLDPLRDEIVTHVRNTGSSAGNTQVNFYVGWSLATALQTASITTGIIPIDGMTEIRVRVVDWDWSQPNSCLPLWIGFRRPESRLELDTYGALTAPSPPVFVGTVCVPRSVLVDDGDYLDSPLNHGWIIPDNQVNQGEVNSEYDPELERWTLHVKVETQVQQNMGFAIRYPMHNEGLSTLSLAVRSESSFIVTAMVRDHDGNYYYVQYMPERWSEYPDAYPKGRYIYFPLGIQLMDGDWHRFTRNVYDDFYARTNIQVAYIESIAIRTQGELWITDLTLSAGDS